MGRDELSGGSGDTIGLLSAAGSRCRPNRLRSSHRREGGRSRTGPFLLLSTLWLGLCSACGYWGPYRTPAGIERWQDPSRPELSLREKARVYQERLESRHQMPDGVIRYKFSGSAREPSGGYGNLADGSFFLGIYLASQALRYAVTADPAARDQVLLSLRGMRLYAEVSGQQGLLARYVSPVAPPNDDRWRHSAVHAGYFWRPDVSKDQYAGFVHGLGVALAVSTDPAIRAQVTLLAAAIADHLIDHDLQLIDWDGERTKYGNLRGRIFGVPIGVNALIVLAAAKTAAEASGAAPYRDLYERLVAEGYPEISYWTHFSLFGLGDRDNDNMAYLALYPLLLMERDERIVAALRRGACRTWRHVRDDRNSFFAFVQASQVGSCESDGEPEPGPQDLAARKGREWLFEFPDRKVAWPVDLTREGFDFPRAFLHTSDGEPRSKQAVPLYLRPLGSSLWNDDPRLLVGRLESHGDIEFAGIDYLVAYWMGRYEGFVAAED
jgi:hypothetical protein